MNNPLPLIHCTCCGLIQQLPEIPKNHKAVCYRCHTPLPQCRMWYNQLTTSFAISALLLYFPAILLPLLKIEKLGYASEDSLLQGVMTLFSQEYYLVGMVVLLFSIIFPPLKLLALIGLSSFFRDLQHKHKALVYHLVEFIGRWGMLDVMLVAILVAFVKLGDLISIQAGSGLIAFTCMVLFSLLASFCFHPYCLWAKATKDL